MIHFYTTSRVSLSAARHYTVTRLTDGIVDRSVRIPRAHAILIDSDALTAFIERLIVL